MIRCINHPQLHAKYHCGKCEIGLCEHCVTPKAFGASKLYMCPKCNEPTADLTPYIGVQPFWWGVGDILLRPFREGNWVTFIGWGIFAILTLAVADFAMSMGGLFAIIAAGFCYALYYSVLISYFWRIIARNEDGRLEIPDFEYEGMSASLIWPVVQFVVSFVSAYLPIVVFAVFMLTSFGFIFEDIAGSPVFVAFIIVCVVFGIVGTMLIPMITLLIGVFRRIPMAFNYPFIVRQIFKIPVEYGILLIFVFAFIIAYSIVKGVFFVALTPLSYTFSKSIGLAFIKNIIQYPIEGALQLYIFMIIGQLLGYMAYQARFKLKWWPENQSEPVFMVQGRPADLSYEPAPVMTSAMRAAMVGGAAAAGASIPPGSASIAPPMASAPPRSPAATGAPAAAPVPQPAGPSFTDSGAEMEMAKQIAEGMQVLAQGNADEAAFHFRQVLDRDPTHLGALRGMVMVSTKVRNETNAFKYGRLMGAELSRRRDFEALYEQYIEISKSFPDFSYETRDQMLVSRWLVQEQKFMEAAKLLREVGVNNPHDPDAPKALYQCGEILWKKCGKPENGAKMFEYILKKYPHVSFADKIKEAMGQIKAESQ